MGAEASQFVPFFVEGPVTTKDEGDMASESKGLAWGFSSMQGWRPHHEDAHVCLPHLSQQSGEWNDTSLFGVFDGHGGEQVARFCERHLPGEIARRPAVDERRALAAAFHRMDEMLATPRGAQELRSLSSRAGSLSDPDPNVVGCTAVVCLIRPGAIFVANAGDSRAVLCRAGKAVPLSHDHKPGDPLERRRIERAGGRVVGQRLGQHTVVHRIDGQLSVSRAIGDLRFKRHPRLSPGEQRLSAEPEVCEVERTPQDEFLIIACDGVWDVLGSQQVVDYIRHHLDAMLRGLSAPSAVLGGLMDQCLAKTPNAEGGKGMDNMTMVLVIFTRPADGRSLLPRVLASATNGLGYSKTSAPLAPMCDAQIPRDEKSRSALLAFMQGGMPFL